MKDKIDRLIQTSGYTAKDYKFKNDIPNRPNALKMYKWLSNEIREINEEIDRIEKEQGVLSKCQKGCSACCKQCIVVLMSEILPIEIYINNLSKENRQDLERRVIDICNKLEQSGITKESAASCWSESAQRELQKKYFEMDIPCIFLNDEDSCVIHEIRPTACWKYREYGDCANCEKSCFSDTSIDYTDWETIEVRRIMEARPNGKKLAILPFAIKEILHL